MPGFVTHYIFGRETYHKLKHPQQKKNLYDNRAAYGLGLQGPDLFFYYLPSYVLHGGNIGALAHTSETNAFFRGLLQSYSRFSSQTDRDIAEAYLTGFLGHYLLDTTCHPYIYAASHYQGKGKDYFSHHAYLEIDIDTALLDMKLHKKPHEFYMERTFSLTRRQKKVIADMLYHAYHYAFPDLRLHKCTMWFGIYSIRFAMGMLRDRTGQKKVLLRFLEKHLLGFPICSPLIASDTLFFRTDPFNLRHAPWHNPWDENHTSRESFFELYEKAMTRHLTMTEELYLLLHTPSGNSQHAALLRKFLTEYGNLSFHSGLDVSIPS